MTFDEYQKVAMTFAKYGYHPDYPFLGLTEEVGEVTGKLAKAVRKNQTSLNSALTNMHHTPDLREDLKKELGDVLWMLQACCTELNLRLEDVAQHNLDKLNGRAERGTIVGSGDLR